MFEKYKKEAPFFTGITRGVGGAGFGKARAAVAAAAAPSSFPSNTDKWGFENNSATSTGPSASALSITGASYSATAKYGTVALSFDGSNDYADWNTGSSISPFSISFWIYWRGHNPSGRSYLVDFRTGGGSNGYWLIDSNNTMSFVINTSGTESTQSWTPTGNTWEHYAWVSDESGTAKVYRNGVLTLTASTSGGGPSAGGNATLATYFGARGGSGNYFTNAIYDNVVWYRGTWTSSNISTLYSDTSTFVT